MTPQEIETTARRILNAVGSNFWSQTEIIEDYLYASALEMATESCCIENRYTTVSVADQAEYSKPSRALKIKRIEYDNEKMKPIDFRRYDIVNTNRDSTTTGEPIYYVEYDESFILYPAPDTSSETIKVYTYDEPSRPTTTSTLEIPTRYHMKLAIGVAYLMSLKELGHPNTSRLEALWLKAVQDTKEMEKKRRRGDGFQRVVTEEELPMLMLGVN